MENLFFVIIVIILLLLAIAVFISYIKDRKKQKTHSKRNINNSNIIPYFYQKTFYYNFQSCPVTGAYRHNKKRPPR